MKIFISHDSKQKLFVKELRKYLPDHIDFWIDEKKILVGDDLAKTIEKTIMEDVDFLILVIDSNSIHSEWVERELSWGLRREEELGRVFLLPILLEESAWESFENDSIKNRKYIKCSEFTDSKIQSTATELIGELFAWVSRELFKSDRLDEKDSTLSLIQKADVLSKDIAEKIRLLVYPYRKENPLDLTKLLDTLKEQSYLSDYTLFDFNDFLIELKKSGHLTGLVSDGEAIWVKQGHHTWKTQLHVKNKEQIAKKAISFIKSGMQVALDSGSTTLEIAKQINGGLKMERWSNLMIVTNSIPAAEELLKFSSERGLGDNNSVLSVFMTEGRIRPNSLAVVDDHEMYLGIDSGFQETLTRLHGVDLCFIGANGLFEDKGFAVHNEFEIQTKKAILENSSEKFIACDASKFSISERRMFASFDENLKVITSSKGYEDEIDKVKAMLENRNSELILTE